MLSKIGKDSSENLPHSLIGKPTHIELFTFQEFHADCSFRSQHLSFQPVHTMTVPNASRRGIKPAMTPYCSERDASRMILTRLLEIPFQRHFTTYKATLCVILGSVRCLNAMRSECIALSAETEGLEIGAAWQAWTPLRHPCFPQWGEVRKCIPSLGLQELE